MKPNNFYRFWHKATKNLCSFTFKNGCEHENKISQKPFPHAHNQLKSSKYITKTIHPESQYQARFDKLDFQVLQGEMFIKSFTY